MDPLNFLAHCMAVFFNVSQYWRGDLKKYGSIKLLWSGSTVG
jgi:hypothetical protein